MLRPAVTSLSEDPVEEILDIFQTAGIAGGRVSSHGGSEKMNCSVRLNFNLQVSIGQSPMHTDASVREWCYVWLRHVLDIQIRQYNPGHRDSPIGNPQAAVAVPVFFQRLQCRDSVVGFFEPCGRLQTLDAGPLPAVGVLVL